LKARIGPDADEMYLRWSERCGYKAQIVDIQLGEEAGIKNATITFSGDYAYGYLGAEAGYTDWSDFTFRRK